MGKKLNNRVESILAGIKPSLGGADIRLKDISQGVVTLEYRRALSNPSACHVDRTKMNKEMVIEILQDKLREITPEFKKIIVLGEE